MAATQRTSRRSVRSAGMPTRQGLRSQMRITKNTQSMPSKKAAVIIKSEIKSESPHDLLSAPPPSSPTADAKPPPLATTATPPRKSKQTQHITTTPFPDFTRPTPSDCALAHDILVSMHGPRARPARVVAPRTSAGCGASPSVLDALVRTILSQNTSAANAALAQRGLAATYGAAPARWAAVAAAGPRGLQRAIRRGGLAATKSRVIVGLLAAVRARHAAYSLDHLFAASDDAAMRELLAFPGVGPKTASCVLLFCLGRQSFPVDTHVYRLAAALGWRPPEASREQAQAHLDALVPDELKYPLHVLLIEHGRTCAACSAKAAGGKSCKLRQAFK